MARILVVEDNRSSLEFMVYLLRAFGHDASGCGVSIEGLDLARSEPFDLIVSDVLMPGIDGFEFVRRIREYAHAKATPLVAVTALAMKGDREKTLESGFDGYIAKPIDPETFVTEIETFLAAKPSQAPAPAEPTILAVDDVQVNLDVLAGTLVPSGYRVITARNVADAIALLERERPAAILCDVHMPDGNGFELIEYLKRHAELSNIPFVFVSSTAWQTRDRRRAMAAGAAKFILRPIDPEELLREVRAVIAKAELGKNSDT